MEQRLTVTRQNDAEHHRQQCQIHLTSLLLASNQEGENCGEERRRCPNGLIERHRKVSQRGIAADNGEAEDGAEGEDLEELTARQNVLEGYKLKPVDGGVAVSSAR